MRPETESRPDIPPTGLEVLQVLRDRGYADLADSRKVIFNLRQGEKIEPYRIVDADPRSARSISPEADSPDASGLTISSMALRVTVQPARSEPGTDEVQGEIVFTPGRGAFSVRRFNPDEAQGTAS